MADFSVNGKEYTVKRKMKFFEVTSLQELFANTLSAQKDIGDPVAFSNLPIEEQMKIIMPTYENTVQQNKEIVKFLNSVLGLTQEQMEALDFEEAFAVFNEGFKIANTMKKKPDVPLDLPSSSATQS